MISLDTSVCMKWVKGGERYETESLDLLQRLRHREIEASANEILGLEIARGLKNAQRRQPALGITEVDIDEAFDLVEGMFRKGIMLECSVRDVKTLSKELVKQFALFMADALHLATALYLGAEFFVVDDHHFLAPEVVNYATRSGVRIANLPDLIAALNTTPTNGEEPITHNP